MDNVNAFEILLVEDNADDEELVLYALAKNNLANHVRVAHDGAEALEILFAEGNTSYPKLVLLDLKLPKIDGLEVLRQIKGNAQTKTIPVVVISSSRAEQDLIRSYQLNANGYVIKPIDFSQFAEAVQQLGIFWLLVNQPPQHS
ncbi:MAG: response regulator [Caldilineaceae bacterium]